LFHHLLRWLSGERQGRIRIPEKIKKKSIGWIQ
jgi:hypothetical protein